jgi:phage anti-repressor protein
MADTDIDAVRKQKKAEYNKQYRLKRKLLLQASTPTETELAEKQQKAEYAKQYRLKCKLLF